MYFKRSFFLYSTILFTLLLIINSNFIISLPPIFAQNTNSQFSSPPPNFQTPQSSNQLPYPPPPPNFQTQQSSNQLPYPPPPPLSEQLSPLQMASSTNKTCILTPALIEQEGSPQQTEGPYFVAGAPNRSNITSDPLDGTVQQGIPLQLVIH